MYQYALVDKSGTYDLAQLRSLQDWFLKFELATVPGVSEVASVGGFVKEYQVLIDPNRLRAFNVPLKRLMEAVRNASMEAGGRVIEKGEMDHDNNPLHNAPHSWRKMTGDDWPHPYTREQAAYALPWVKERKFWPAVGRIDNVFGDRHLHCTCPSVEDICELQNA